MEEFFRSGILNILGFSIYSETKPQDLRDQVFFETKEDKVNGWVSFFLEKVEIASQNFNIRLLFTPEEKLSTISMSTIFPDEEIGWSNWDREKEDRRHRIHELFIKELISEMPQKIDWGEISANFSPQSGVSSITIRYF